MCCAKNTAQQNVCKMKSYIWIYHISHWTWTCTKANKFPFLLHYLNISVKVSVSEASPMQSMRLFFNWILQVEEAQNDFLWWKAKQIHIVQVFQHKKKCNHCNSNCVTAKDLKSHTKTHTGEEPFKCNKCNEAFTWKYQMTKLTYITSDWMVNHNTKWISA